jgi:excisionase family DNA binding protein
LEHGEHRTTNPGVPPNTSPGQARRLLSLNEAATVLGLSKVSIRRLIWSGKLPSVRILRRIQIDIRDLDRFIERSKER